MLDVAKRANVALSTVSYALNNTRPVSDETRQRIFKAMEDLGYRPHALARGLASKRSRIIALLFPAPERGLGITELEFVTNATDTARENGYNLLLWSSEMHDPNELRLFVQQGLVDGVIVMEIHLNDERINLLREIGFPFSMIGRCAETDGLGYVDIDFERTMQEAVNHLAVLGHKNIAFLNQSQSAFETGYGPAVRTQAEFAKAIQIAGLEGISRFCRPSPQAGYEACNELLVGCPGLTALITMNERAVPGIMQAIADRGWRIPDDFSLVVIASSARMAEMMTPPLTTSDIPVAELSRLGVELLIQQLDVEERQALQELVPCRLVVRGSTGPCPRNLEKSGNRPVLLEEGGKHPEA
ncbi:MAG: LacI family DNA-binding transcriptional regulator [Anaerolineales bacterium]